jgi:uncharacterized protein
MKKQVFLISGGNAFSNYEDFLQSLKTVPLRNLPGSETKTRWSQSLISDLGEDFEVFVPAMPNTQNAQYEEWRIWFLRHLEYLREDVILIGWSLGGMFLAKYLAEREIPFQFKNLYLLAAPCAKYSDGEGNDCGSFQFSPEALGNLIQYGDKIEIWHSEDDFVVPYEHALKYKIALPAAKLVTSTDKNHFLLPEFPELIESIRLK